VANYKIVITDTTCFVLLSKIDAFGLLQNFLEQYLQHLKLPLNMANRFLIG
jgi:hypothetical protein